MVASTKSFIILLVLCMATVIMVFLYNFVLDHEIEVTTTTPTVLCIILTHRSNFETKTKAVYTTWAQNCDKHFFITNKESNDIYSILQPSNNASDDYGQLTDKVYGAIIDIYKTNSNYDWYLKADDDTYIFMDHLKDFLRSKNPNSPVTYGYDFDILVTNGYHSGGAGYVLSKEAFKKLGSKLLFNYTHCPNSGSEDVDIAGCLRMLDVYPESSIDEFERERFHVFNVSTNLLGNFPEWVHSYRTKPIKAGIECCSEQTVSFHYVSPEDILKLHTLWNNYKIHNSMHPKMYKNFTSILFEMI